MKFSNGITLIAVNDADEKIEALDEALFFVEKALAGVTIQKRITTLKRVERHLREMKQELEE